MINYIICVHIFRYKQCWNLKLIIDYWPWNQNSKSEWSCDSLMVTCVFIYINDVFFYFDVFTEKNPEWSLSLTLMLIILCSNNNLHLHCIVYMYMYCVLTFTDKTLYLYLIHTSSIVHVDLFYFYTVHVVCGIVSW